MSITLGRSDKGCAECYDITQGIGTVIVQYYINHIILGKHKLEMSFPDNMNPSSMIEEIDKRVRDFHMKTMGIEEEVKDLPNSHEYVDLGLSVKWATCNIGASSPEEYGDYFAWGETETKSSYDEDNCETWEKEIGDIKGTSRDVAHVKWGGSWRMPTRGEIDELIYNCDWEWTTQNGINGYKVTGKNGNSIFLPAVGIRARASLGRTGTNGSYWCSTPYEGNTQTAYYLDFGSSGYHDTYWDHSRGHGFSVRPVISKEASDGNKTNNTTREKVEDVSGATTLQPIKEFNGHKYADLGLSVKWATCNVGANKPEEYGDYYAWGETKTKSSYDLSNCVLLGRNIKDIKGTNCDVAHVKWGGSWRMPTKAEFDELLNKCTWTWATKNGTNGFKVTSKNGNSIFLPAVGYRYNKTLAGAGEDGYYWSSTSKEGDSWNACYLYFFSGNRCMIGEYRMSGRPVRPVLEF